MGSELRQTPLPSILTSKELLMYSAWLPTVPDKTRLPLPD
jgi:hypothetical protein